MWKADDDGMGGQIIGVVEQGLVIFYIAPEVEHAILFNLNIYKPHEPG